MMHDKPKPLRDEVIKYYSEPRIPEHGYLTPRLRHSPTVDAVGLIHRFPTDDGD